MDQVEIKKYGIDKYQCLNDEAKYDIYGNFYRNEMNYLEIKLWKC